MAMRRWLAVAWLLSCVGSLRAEQSASVWPEVRREAKPWAYWWWMASAVDPTNLVREIERASVAGLGGLHIVPIYGAKGWEDRATPFLTERWMKMLDLSVREAGRRDMGVDITLGTGWCFGGPWVSEADGDVVTSDGTTMKPGMRVKRAAPGGEGRMINPLSAGAMRRYLEVFEKAFAQYDGARPRAIYHDSYEYRSNWAPELLEAFEKKHGYRLQEELGALFGKEEDDHVARVKHDYRETLSDLMVEGAWPLWSEWGRKRGFLTRDEAHGAPGNWLDLYALADIPETEMFHTDRNILISKFASSAAHVTGKPLVSAETGTWLKEHFNETLADLKGLADDMFLAGVNHIFYHGMCYSPDEAPWPGWLFYAATEMNPRNPIWRDAPALNAYIARCQSVLQSGEPDNEVLLYWPIHDLWYNAKGVEMNLTIHAQGWFVEQPVGGVARQLWDRGYGFDYISDRQLAALKPGRYRAVVVPPCEHMPEGTKKALAELKRAGMPVITADEDWMKELSAAGVLREAMVDWPGLQFIRRKHADGHDYLIVNRGPAKQDGWVPLAKPAKSVLFLDPLSGRSGVGEVRDGSVRVQLEPGHSMIVRTSGAPSGQGAAWKFEAGGKSAPLSGEWDVEFLAGGPEFPAGYRSRELGFWTARDDRFAGTVRYTLRFDWPDAGSRQFLDLGVVRESARVRLNGKDLGTLIMAPYCIEAQGLLSAGNVLEVEVTSLAANRIRDLDRRKVQWKVFRDINFVSITYKPFDAAVWPVVDCGLLGPVALRSEAPR